MMGAKSRLAEISLKLVSLLLMLLVFLPVFPAYALDNNYVINEYNNWLDVDERIDYERSRDGFDGFLKKFVDEKNGCFYMYFSFYDARLDGFDDENIVISFDLQNDVNSYSFSVNRNGFVNTGEDEQKNIRLAYNFENCSINRRGGEILIGFELTDKTDRQLYNSISCEYAGGISNTAVLFNAQGLDMYVEPTVKKNTSRAVKTTKAAKSTSVKGSQSVKRKSESTTQGQGKTTKYTPTGTVKYNDTKEPSTKFSGNKVYLQGHTESDNEIEYETPVAAASDAVIGSFKMSKTAVVVMTVAIVLVAAGIILVITGLAVKSKKDKNPPEMNTDDEN